MFSKLGLRMGKRTQNTLSSILFSRFIVFDEIQMGYTKKEQISRKEGKWREIKKEQQNLYMYEPLLYLLLLLLWPRFSSAIPCSVRCVYIWFCFTVQLPCGFSFQLKNYFHSAQPKASCKLQLCCTDVRAWICFRSSKQESKNHFEH